MKKKMVWKHYLIGFQIAIGLWLLFMAVFIVPSNVFEQNARVLAGLFGAAFLAASYGIFKESKIGLTLAGVLAVCLFIPNPVSLLVLPFIMFGISWNGILSQYIGEYFGMVLGYFIVLGVAAYTKWR